LTNSQTKVQRINIQQIAFWIAIVIHFFGLIGILFFDRSWFVALTPVNLVMMLVLLWLTHPKTNTCKFYLFFLICWCTGMAVEIIGTNTGLLFGQYSYGEVLGPGVAGVPVLIGINWFSIVYSSAAIADKLLPPAPVYNVRKAQRKLGARDIALGFTGAMLTTFFDWVMEPVAVKLGYWEWNNDGEIPLYNYVCWFAVSFLLLVISSLMKFSISNRFAVWLFVIQLIFFLVLRLFLPH
jgi:bisanhydrobacterioruberin hydratase